MRRAAGRCTAAIIAAALALAACGGSASNATSRPTTNASVGTTTSGRDAAAAAPNSAWTHVLQQVRPNGQVSLATALAAFAMAIGPVPGAVVPAGVSAPIDSGTLAVMGCGRGGSN